MTDGQAVFEIIRLLRGELKSSFQAGRHLPISIFSRAAPCSAFAFFIKGFQKFSPGAAQCWSLTSASRSSRMFICKRQASHPTCCKRKLFMHQQRPFSPALQILAAALMKNAGTKSAYVPVTPEWTSGARTPHTHAHTHTQTHTRVQFMKA